MICSLPPFLRIFSSFVCVKFLFQFHRDHAYRYSLCMSYQHMLEPRPIHCGILMNGMIRLRTHVMDDMARDEIKEDSRPGTEKRERRGNMLSFKKDVHCYQS